MKFSVASSLAALVVSPCFCASAEAAPLSALEVLQQFNLVAFGNVVSASHVDGRAYVGGNVAGGDYVQHVGDTPKSAYAGLTVGGNASNVKVGGLGTVVGGSISGGAINGGGAAIKGNASNLNFQGSSSVGGNAGNVNFSGTASVLGNASSVNFNGASYLGGSASNSNFNGARLAAPVSDATLQSQVAAAVSTDLKSALNGLSDQLKTLSGSGSSVVVSGNRVTFNALADADGLAVFDLTAIDTLLFSKSEFAFNINGAKTIIFNTDETTYNISANFLGGSAADIGKIAIWNFYNASSVTLNSQFGGVVLATDAALTNRQNIEGSVIVNSLQQNGEIHLQAFTGSLPTTPVSDRKLPEPGSLALLLGSLGLLALRRRGATRDQRRS